MVRRTGAEAGAGAAEDENADRVIGGDGLEQGFEGGEHGGGEGIAGGRAIERDRGDAVTVVAHQQGVLVGQGRLPLTGDLYKWHRATLKGYYGPIASCASVRNHRERACRPEASALGEPGACEADSE